MFNVLTFKTLKVKLVMVENSLKPSAYPLPWGVAIMSQTQKGE